MTVISEQEHRSNGATPLAKLCRMLRSTLRRYPQARLWNMQDGFGVSLDAQTYMRVSLNGNWTAEATRDCLALFATWLVADPAKLLDSGTLLAGALQAAQAESAQFSTRQV